MQSEFLSALEKQPRLNLKAGKILYGCDIQILAGFKMESLSFSAHGTARFGPKKSPIRFGSTYAIENELNLKKAWFEIPGIKRSELYQINDCEVESSINGEDCRITPDPGDKILDILLLLHLFVRPIALTESAVIPIGNKLRGISITENSGVRHLSFGSKVNLQFKNGKIAVSKYKVLVDCVFD